MFLCVTQNVSLEMETTHTGRPVKEEVAKGCAMLAGVGSDCGQSAHMVLQSARQHYVAEVPLHVLRTLLRRTPSTPPLLPRRLPHQLGCAQPPAHVPRFYNCISYQRCRMPMSHHLEIFRPVLTCQCRSYCSSKSLAGFNEQPGGASHVVTERGKWCVALTCQRLCRPPASTHAHYTHPKPGETAPRPVWSAGPHPSTETSLQRPGA